MSESKINNEKEQQEAGSKTIAIVAGLAPMILLPWHKCTGISVDMSERGEKGLRLAGWLAGWLWQHSFDRGSTKPLI